MGLRKEEESREGRKKKEKGASKPCLPFSNTGEEAVAILHLSLSSLALQSISLTIGLYYSSDHVH